MHLKLSNKRNQKIRKPTETNFVGQKNLIKKNSFATVGQIKNTLQKAGGFLIKVNNQ